jgi:2-keto-3-deoxy-L-rhamnonate aldolase RhmA
MSWSFNYIAITNEPCKAEIFSDAGIQQVMIDTEIIGKVERQGHKDTVINNHALNDIYVLKKLNLNSEIICRVNPYNKNSYREINTAIDLGVDLIMIPMITKLEDYISMVDWIGDRVKIIPLIETPYSFFKLSELLDVTDISQVHFGLNDLCIGVGMKNLFEVLLSDTFQVITKSVNVGVKGIGGIGDPQKVQRVSPIALLNAYMKCDSNSVILSRNFFMESSDKDYIVRSLRIFEEVIKSGYNSIIDLDFSAQVHEM